MTQTVNHSGLQTFSYEKPTPLDTPKLNLHLVRADVLGLGAQVFAEGGDTPHQGT